MAITTNEALNLIQEQVANFLVEPLTKASVVLAAQPRVFRSAQPFKIPTIGEYSPTETSYGELETITEGSAEFGEISLMPTERKSLKTLTVISNELIREANVVGIEAALQNRIVTDVQNSLDDALLLGTGVSGSITGLVNQTGIQTGTFDDGDADSILDGLALLDAKETKANAIFMSGADFLTMRKLKDADGRYLMDTSVHADVPHTLFGVNVIVTNKMPVGKALVANMQDVAIVIDQDPQVTIDRSAYFAKDAVGIRVTARADLGLLRKESVALLTATV